MTRRSIGPRFGSRGMRLPAPRNVCTLPPGARTARALSPRGRPADGLQGEGGWAKPGPRRCRSSSRRRAPSSRSCWQAPSTVALPAHADRDRLSDRPARPNGSARPSGGGPAIDGEALLAELLASRGAARLVRLRRLGDAALFVAGFFGESLARVPFGPTPTREAGRLAYGALSAALARLAEEPQLEPALRRAGGPFPATSPTCSPRWASARAARPPRLAALYARYLATGSARDRRRLLRLGALAPELGGLLRPQ